MRTSEERFWPKVNKRGPVYRRYGRCWVWQGAFHKQGYGSFLFEGKIHLAHRVSIALVEGRLPKSSVLHRCDNPPCVRPSHLFRGTQRDNIADMVSKDRQGRGMTAKLSPSSVRRIRELLKKSVPYVQIAKLFNVSQKPISQIASGVTWKHVR